MKRLTLDPSSTSMGYATFISGRLDEFGTFDTDASDRGLSPAVAVLGRAAILTRSVQEMIRELRPGRIVIELPAPAPNWGKNSARGLAYYGMAVGVILCGIREVKPAGCELVTPQVNEWVTLNGKQTRKAQRIDWVAAHVPEYNARADAKGDVADAICLGWWDINGGNLAGTAALASVGRQGAGLFAGH